MAFVLIQHLDPNHESLMADLLSKHTSLPVVQVEKPTAIEPDHVYVIPPNKYIALRKDTLCLELPVKARGMRMPIDRFFCSLAEARAERAVCIVLSGMGSDGTLGLKEVKAAGGIALVQTPDSTEYDGMPRSALASGMVDHVVPVEAMPEILVEYARHPYTTGGEGPVRLHETSPSHFNSIVNLLYAHTDYDFRYYKKGTLNRRIERRMGLRQVRQLADYLQLLRNDTTEVRALFKDLLIGVTRFFREKEAYDVLEEQAIVKLVAEKQPGETIRVWVPGCATGEEVYSIAMLLFEQIERQGKRVSVQLFGTDLDEDSVATARSGVYPASVAGDISAERLRKFFKEEHQRVCVSKQLRECCVFAVQNIVGDPPFSNLDLISCRNVLIYLEADVQRRLMRLFHFALNPKGFLFLGTSESISRTDQLFEPVAGSWRIYRKIGQRQPGDSGIPLLAQREAHSTRLQPFAESVAGLGTVEVARKALLDRFAPPSVLIDVSHNVQYFHGEVQGYLSLPSGQPTHDLLAMTASGLRSKLRGLIRQASQEKQRVTGLAPRTTGDEEVLVRLTVEPVLEHGAGDALLVSFTDEPARDAKSPRKHSRRSAQSNARASQSDSDETIS